MHSTDSGYPKKTKDLSQDLYCTFSLRLKEEQLIQGKALFIDDTRFEADASKHTFVWKKSVDLLYSNLKEKEIQYYEEEIAPLINQAIERDQNRTFTKEEGTKFYIKLKFDVEPTFV